MAFVNDIRSFETNVMSHLSSAARSLSEGWEKSRQYKMTMRELSTLDERELDDLGMARGDISDVAYRAVYGR